MILCPTASLQRVENKSLYHKTLQNTYSAVESEESGMHGIIGVNKDLWYRTCRTLASLVDTEKGEFPLMLNIRDLKIDNASLGQKKLLIEVVPAYEYKDKQRADTIMKTYLHALIMCQSMFCAIPAPQLWDEKARDKMLLFLPVVGLEIGAIWAAIAWICRILNLPTMITALILSAYPYIVTGFLHLDGFMDVTDAVKSWRDLDRRREILKDSHVGSFAVIGVVLLLIAQFAFFGSAPVDANFLILIFVPAVSRCCSALAVTGLKPMSTSQYADQRKPKSHMVVLAVMLSIFLGLGFLLCGKYGFALVGCLVGYGFALRRAYKSLDGMNGDISGYALTIGELCAVAVYALI